MRLKTICICILIFVVGLVSAQSLLDTTEYLDEITLVNSSVYIGHVSYISDTETVIRILGGHQVHIPAHQIRKHKQILLRGPEQYAFREKGPYNQINLSIIAAEGKSLDGPIGGFSIDYVLGRSIHRSFRGGLGIGLQLTLLNEDNYLLLPVFLDFGGYTKSKKVSPYYGLQIGKAQVLTSSVWNRPDKENVWFLYPRFGLRFNGGDGATSHLIIGMRMTSLVESTIRPEWELERIIRSYRWVLTYQISF